MEKLRSLRSRDTLDFYGTGGDAMSRAGVHLLRHVRDLAHIGAREALSSFRTYYETYRHLAAESAAHRPDLAILLDFPEFNLRMAKKLKRMGIPVIYYIGPQVWAWRSGRVRIIRKCVDQMLVILPFEEDFYRKRGVEVQFVGHPLLEGFKPHYDREAFLRGLDMAPDRKTVAILAGSRRKEIDYILPVMLRAGQCLLATVPAQFLISVASTVEIEHIRAVLRRVVGDDPAGRHFRVLTQDSRDILANSDFAFVKSGTSSLEAALVGVPFLITYRISPISWCVGSLLIRSPMKGLVNLIAQKKIVPELFQYDAKPRELARIASEYLEKPEKRDAMRAQLAGIRHQLSVRCASETVATVVSRYL